MPRESFVLTWYFSSNICTNYIKYIKGQHFSWLSLDETCHWAFYNLFWDSTRMQTKGSITIWCTFTRCYHYCVLWIHWLIKTDSSHKAASFCLHVPLNCCLCRRLASFRSEARPLTRTDCVSKQRIKWVNVESEIWTFVQLIKITACMRSAGDSRLHCALTANLNVKTHVCVCVCRQSTLLGYNSLKCF